MNNKYRVWIRSRPGMYEQYDGYVDVYASSEDTAGTAAKQKLKRTSFPDRSSDMWIIERTEKIG